MKQSKAVLKKVLTLGLAAVMFCGMVVFASGCDTKYTYKCTDGSVTRKIVVTPSSSNSNKGTATLYNFYYGTKVDTVNGESGTYTISGTSVTIKIDNSINNIYRNQPFKGTISSDNTVITAYTKKYTKV